jgi:hypothetical protein
LTLARANTEIVGALNRVASGSIAMLNRRTFAALIAGAAAARKTA